MRFFVCKRGEIFLIFLHSIRNFLQHIRNQYLLDKYWVILADEWNLSLCSCESCSISECVFFFHCFDWYLSELLLFLNPHGAVQVRKMHLKTLEEKQSPRDLEEKEKSVFTEQDFNNFQSYNSNAPRHHNLNRKLGRK